MCGFAGFLDPTGSVPPDRQQALARTMAATLHHRGPDDGGQWGDPAAGVAFGFRRLAIVDLSAEGHQPMASSCGRYVVVFNGEIYNHRDLRAVLDAGGTRPWRGHADTEVLLEAISEWGLTATLAQLDGMFAFALWDRPQRRLTLVRDRMGEKPLFYGRLGGAFVFASEPKALTRHPGWTGEADCDAIALYLRHGYVPGPFSAWRGIAKLPPGHRLDLPADAVARAASPPEPAAYWDAGAEAAAAPPFTGDEAEATDTLDRLIRRSVGRRMLADVPVGAFLSGGIDSSTVAAAMQAEAAGRVRTFSIGFEDERFDEAPHAAAVARHLGTDHTAMHVTPADCHAVIPRLAGIYDEPFADASQIPTLLLCELTRRHVTVGLSGDGGDELFGGYARYRAAEHLWQRTQWLRRSAAPLARRGAAAFPASHLDALIGMPGAVFGRRRSRAAQRLQHRLETIGHATPARLYRDYVSWWRDGDGIHRQPPPPSPFERSERGAATPTLAQRFMFMDVTSYLPDDLLVKIDRASMATSLEARAPMLDHRIVQFSWSLPPSLCFRDGVGKWLLRRVLHRYVPPALVDRPKQGFEVPIGDWLRGPLRDWADDLLSARALADNPFVRPAPVIARWREHRSGARNWAYPLWTILMLHAWLGIQQGAR